LLQNLGIRSLATDKDNQSMMPYLHIALAVQKALSNHHPIVALESTLITHGLPRPVNLEVARRLKALAHSNGVPVAQRFAAVSHCIKASVTSRHFDFMSELHCMTEGIQSNPTPQPPIARIWQSN
jgi:pseudouridine-5'-phosphate glycosidase